MSTASYLLIRFDDKEKLLPAITTLAGQKQIAGWDAVDGYYHLVIRTGQDAAALSEFVGKLDGFAELARCEVSDGNGIDSPRPDDPAQSYLFLEVQKDARTHVMDNLRQNDKIAYCLPATGRYDFVALAHGKSFDEIDRLVNDHIRLLDGVLRLKQDRIIHLDRM